MVYPARYRAVGCARGRRFDRADFAAYPEVAPRGDRLCRERAGSVQSKELAPNTLVVVAEKGFSDGRDRVRIAGPLKGWISAKCTAEGFCVGATRVH